jgi:hypothetical protein
LSFSIFIWKLEKKIIIPKILQILSINNYNEKLTKGLEAQMKIKTIYLTVILLTFVMASSAFSLQYTFQPRISASEEYTSNVFLSKDNEKDDFITIVSAGFTAAALGKKGGFEVSYDPAYTKYADFDENDTWRQEAGLRIWSDLAKSTKFEISNSFLYTEDPLGDESTLALSDGEVTQEGDSTVRKTRRTYYRNTARARLTHQFGKDDSIHAGFRYGILRNNNPQDEDNDNYSPEIGLNYWFGPKFGFESNAAYTKANFNQDSDFVGEGSSDFDNYAGSIRFIVRTNTRFSVFTQYNQIYRDFEGNNDNDYMVYAPSAGFTYVVDKGLNLRLGAGYFYQDVDNTQDEQALFGNSQIDKTWLYKRGSLSLMALTGLAQSNFGAENVGLERFAALQGLASYALARTLTWDVNGNYRYSDVVGRADQGANDNTGEKVQRIIAGSGLTFNPLKWMAIRLSYTFNKLISENEEDEYDEHRGLLEITLTPSQPYRHID